MKIMQFAQEIDLSARNFYNEMALRADNPGVRRIFEMLAADESELLSRHGAMATSVGAIDAETFLGGANVFEQLRRREDQLTVENDLAAYRLALEAEREVLRQYQNAVNAEKLPAVKDLLAEMTRDEQQHVEELESLYDFANAPNQYLAWGEFSNLGDFHNFGRDID
ncbi:MAG: hypothetical protein NDI73_09420 [Desulfuromonadales bacterium]|nr:hypothetical protein [Desulfuromonadales bacterium]